MKKLYKNEPIDTGLLLNEAIRPRRVYTALHSEPAYVYIFLTYVLYVSINYGWRYLDDSVLRGLVYGSFLLTELYSSRLQYLGTLQI